MTRRGPASPASHGDAPLRLKKAEAYLQAARDGLALLETEEVADPVVSNIVNSAIGFADAVTATIGGVINRQDHKAVVKLLRSLLNDRFAKGEAARLTRILDRKEAAQYGTTFVRPAEAARLLVDLEKFAEWARRTISERR